MVRRTHARPSAPWTVSDMETTRSIVKARKNHRCEVCGWLIVPSEEYERCVTFDGDVSVWKMHQTPCAKAADQSWLDGYEDGGMIGADSVAEWASEYAPKSPIAAELHARLVANSRKALDGERDE